MGHSQYLNLPLIQIADVTGVYGISFIVVIFNAAIADLIEQLWFKGSFKSGIDSVVFSGKKRRLFYFTIIIPCLLLFLVSGYGYFNLRSYKSLQDGPDVCVVQGNIPQGVKINANEKQREEILMKYVGLSLKTLKTAGKEIDLIAWPETMVPGILNIDPDILDRKIDRLSKESVQKLTDVTSANLILGGTAIDVKDNLPLYFNTAFFLIGKENL
ncbi:MAG: apolipoprotein N-acyltransferase [Candidatus Scalindua rubra]|uniref:Apolipoprotein N-acyltransferase n=1 Tax=Candidatus Scalindua rubra TaxID=1872076 RepID=A0A1E3XE97_9BACT|nr:MAG: apolipoprotein N-acyltransferase [Candidatus Scalindua rubra]